MPDMESARQLRFRPATAPDAAFLRTLHDRNRPEFAALPDPERQALLAWQYQARSASYAERYPEATSWLIVVEHDPIGAMMVNASRQQVDLIDFALLPEWQGQGLGKATLARLQVCAHPRSITLHVWPQTPAQRLYENAGFQIVGQEGPYVAMRWSLKADGFPVAEF